MASTSPNSDSVLIEKPSSGKDRERPDQRDRHREQRDQRRPDALQEDEDHQDHERQRLEQRDDDLVDARGDGQRRVQRDDVVEIVGEARLHLAPSALRARVTVARALEPGSW